MRIPMHRFKYTKLTPQQIGEKLKAAEAGPRSASAFSNVLNGTQTPEAAAEQLQKGLDSWYKPGQ